MDNQSASGSNEDLDRVLARYLEAAKPLEHKPTELRLLQERFLADHPDLAPHLKSYFEDETIFGSELGGLLGPLFDFRRYTHITYVGHGGMGVVYQAFDKELKRTVALKMSLPDRLVMPDDVKRFRIEAQSMANLKHPNIVRVLDLGEHEGRPFLTMEFVESRSLHEHLDRFVKDQRSAATLLVDVARAVHHAHQRRILHRDLKPANILLDRDENNRDRPCVADFGLAKPLLGDGLHTETPGGPNAASHVYQKVVGTPSYMSPEQAEGKEATTLIDVYGLGATLYALLTGKAPFKASTKQQILQQVKDPNLRPKLPREMNPGVDRTLEAICLKCLEKDPDNRYRSAEGVAKDLERWLGHRPTDARPVSAVGRLWLWCRRNPLGVALVALALVSGTLVGLHIAQRLQEPSRALQALARQRADIVHLRLEQLSQAVSTAARDSELARLLRQRNLPALQVYIRETGSRRVDLDGQSPFESWFITDVTGKILARWPVPSEETVQVDFSGRDYLQGALRLAKTEAETPVYISKVYKALADELYKFGIACAVWDGGKILGTVIASVTTSPKMGLPAMEDEEFPTALLAPRDPFLVRGKPAIPGQVSEFLILLHPAYRRRTEPVWISRDIEDDIGKGLVDDYYDPVASLTDPVAEKYQGRWVASFAPVEGSQFVVVVQRRYSQAIPAELWVVVALCLAAALAVGAVKYVLPWTRKGT